MVDQQSAPGTAAAKGATSWILELLKALLPGLVLAVVGYVLTGAVTQAQKEHELQIDAIKNMQALSADLQKPAIGREDALAGAAELAAYGKYSVPFFINVQEIGNQYGVRGALEGLRMVARSDPEVVCDQVSAVIRNRTGLYHWQSHLAALQLIGEVRCDAATAAVKSYQAAMGSLATLSTWVANPPPEPSEFDKIHAELQTTVERLNRPVPRAPSKPWFGRSR